MDRDFLKNFGLDTEAINKILDQASKDIGKAIDKKDQEITSLKSDLSEKDNNLNTANETIKALKKSNSDNSELQKQIESYQQQIEQQTIASQKERISMYLDLALTKAGAINPATVKPLLDMDKVSIAKDNSITGIDEQITAIKENNENAFLFNAPTTPKPTNEETQSDRHFFGGYNPLAGETNSESFGTSQGLRVKQKFQSESQDVNDFWANVENGHIQ